MNIRKITLVLIGALIVTALFAEEVSTEVDLSNYGLEFGGGVKTGIMVMNRDYGGHLGNIAMGQKMEQSLYFASFENQARRGVAWFNVGYSWHDDQLGDFGVKFGMWAHGDLKTLDDNIRLGDHYIWANLYEDRLRLIIGQGGGTPISSGGWINADWLSYPGVRVFWVDDSGFSAGLNFPDPGEEGIRPVNYLSMLKAGVSYRSDDWSVSFQLSNNPIYDDSKSNHWGGLHRPHQDPIAMSGNIAFSAGLNSLFNNKGFIMFEGLFTDLGEDNIRGLDSNYTYSPSKTAFALQAGFPFTDQIYGELKGKYTISKGPNELLTAASTWGKIEFEPYVRYQAYENVAFNLSWYIAYYINSYYLALDNTALPYKFNAGQVPGYDPLLDYLSTYQTAIKPSVSFDLGNGEFIIGYEGSFSRDHVQNIGYIDFRWSF
ncbi:MAG: hypothetical protein LBC80_10780 [Treponema sp.]|jgi:hypothetical protein|nr:hypothetical protein [Treponema sp.]